MTMGRWLRSAGVAAALLASVLLGACAAVAGTADTAGPVRIVGSTGGPHQIMIAGQPFGPPDGESWSVSIDGAFPHPDAPAWVVLAYGDGGNACDGLYRVLDLSGPAPVLTEAIGTCGGYTLLPTETQLIFDFESAVWVYTSATGLRQLPPAPPEDQVRAGVAAYDRGDYEVALRLLWPLRLSPLADAPYYAGLMAVSGKGMPVDLARAAALFQLAAELNHSPAMVHLGQMAAEGQGMPANAGVAARWFRQAAELGDAVGQYSLGQSLLAGAAGPPDPAAALKWLLLAAARLEHADQRAAATAAAQQAEAQIPPAVAAGVRRGLPTWHPRSAALFSGPADLRGWVGRYPLDRVRGHVLLDVPDLKARLTAALGAETVAALRPMTVAEPVTEQSGWLLFGGCTPHACNTGHFAVAVNLISYDVLACARLENPTQDTDRMVWGASGVTARQTPIAPEEDDACAQPNSPDGLAAFLNAAAG